MSLIWLKKAIIHDINIKKGGEDMIKRLLLVIIIILSTANIAATAFCDTAVTKLGRGLANILTFPLEVPEQISRVNNANGPFAASTVGVLKGLGCAAGRVCVGIFETATFMIPFPDDYKAILNDPEYFLENNTY